MLYKQMIYDSLKQLLDKTNEGLQPEEQINYSFNHEIDWKYFKVLQMEYLDSINKIDTSIKIKCDLFFQILQHLETSVIENLDKSQMYKCEEKNLNQIKEKVIFNSKPCYYFGLEKLDSLLNEENLDDISDYRDEVLLSILKYIVNESSPQILIYPENEDKDKIISLIKVQILSNGEFFLKPIKYAPPSIGGRPLVAIDLSVDYSQYDEILHYINESNFTENLLEKYLKVYQVLENSMIRTHVVTMVNKGRFNLRELRYVLKNKDVEKDFLTELYKSIDCFAGNPISVVISNYFKSIAFQTQAEKDSIETTLNNLQKNLFDQNNIKASSFANLTYIIRNAIVHNKETEIHLTYGYLEKCNLLIKFLNDFMIPSLEYLSFLLIVDSSDNNPIRYNQNTLVNSFATALKNQIL